MSLSVGLLLEIGVRTAIIRGVPNYFSRVKTEVGLHSIDVSL